MFPGSSPASCLSLGKPLLRVAPALPRRPQGVGALVLTGLGWEAGSPYSLAVLLGGQLGEGGVLGGPGGGDPWANPCSVCQKSALFHQHSESIEETSPSSKLQANHQ